MCTHSTAHYPHYTTHFYLLFPFFLTGSLTVVVYFCVCIFHLVYSGTTYNFDLSCVQPAKGKGVATYFAQELDDTGDSSDYFYYLSLFGLPDKEFGTCLFVWLFRLFDCLAFRWLHVTGTFFWVEGGRMAITVYNKVQGKKTPPTSASHFIAPFFLATPVHISHRTSTIPSVPSFSEVCTYRTPREMRTANA